MPYYSSILPSVFVDASPRALIAKTKSNQSQGRKALLLKVLHSCLMCRFRWEGQCLRLETSTFKTMPCHVSRQSGGLEMSRPLNVNMTLFVNIGPFFEVNDLYCMTLSIAHWST